jgi:DNA-directed RNA polymerase specialized sigma24 family protein
MKNHSFAGPGAYDSDSDDEFLATHDADIRSAARRAVPSGLSSANVVELDPDDVAQVMRYKLCSSRQKRPITSPKSYIRAVAHTTVVDIIRRHKPTVSLYSDTVEEPGPADFLIARNEGFQDPLYELELREIDSTHLAKLVEGILALPSRQRQAIIYVLKKSKNDGLPLLSALEARGIDIDSGGWLAGEREIHLLKASLAVARKKLHYLLAEFRESN